jgi:hypothetical protein
MIIGFAVVCVASGSSAKPVAVSPQCDAALKAVADNGDKPDSVISPLLDAALTACASKAEWIAADQRHHVDHYSNVISGEPVDVWNWFCGSSNAPACTNT